MGPTYLGRIRAKEAVPPVEVEAGQETKRCVQVSDYDKCAREGR